MLGEDPALQPRPPRQPNPSTEAGEDLLTQNFKEIPDLFTRPPDSSWIPSWDSFFASQGK